MEKMRQWTMITALSVVAVLVAGWMLVIKPQRSHAADLRGQAAGVEQSNSQLRNQVSALKAQAKDLPKQQARLAAIEKKIPGNPALPSLIRSLSDAADSAGVELVSLSPSAPTALAVQAAAVRTPTRQTAAKTATPALEQIAVTLSVTGSYFNVEQFVSNLEELQRAMIVDGWSLAPGGKAPTADGKSGASDSLSAQVNARVFMAPPAATPSKPQTSKVGG